MSKQATTTTTRRNGRTRTNAAGYRWHWSFYADGFTLHAQRRLIDENGRPYFRYCRHARLRFPNWEAAKAYADRFSPEFVAALDDE